jgi:Rad3-related DNA helicase
MGNIDLLILDEAHECIEELATALEIRINHAANNNVYHLLSITPPYKSPLPAWKYWASQSIVKVRQQVQTFKGDGGGDVKVLRVLDGLLKNLTRLATVEDTWIVDETSTPAEVLFSPIWPTDYAHKILFRDIPHILLVSATIVPKTLELLGVPDDDSLYVSHTNVFPASRCPVYLYGASRIDHKSTFEDLQVMISRMDTLISRRLDRKGIIHPTSYDRGQLIAANSRYGELMIMPKGQGLVKGLERFRESEPPAILNSPAVTTGYDFPGSQCEYQFLVKVPFMDTRSPIMAARCKADPEYSAYLTAQILVQTCGRAMRGAEDRVENFLMDKHANWFFMPRKKDYQGKMSGGYRHLFPDWFLKQLVYPSGPPTPPARLTQ